MNSVEELLQQEIHRVAHSIINILENRNLEDDIDDILAWELNKDFYDGKIKGREEAIKLIKKAFRMEE